jgi:hypothetical protein
MDERVVAEYKKRKQPINLAIVYVDPDAFVSSFPGWLEITHYVTALKAGEVSVSEDGAPPKLSPQELRGGVAAKYARDAIFAFCMTAALGGDKPAVEKIETGLKESLGEDFPGSVALWPFRSTIDEPATLEDAVGQAGRKMLAGDPLPPPMRAKENWMTGLRFFEKARDSNFSQEIMFPLAKWHRERWNETAEKGVAFLHHIEDNVPILREALAETRNDPPFIANLLLKSAPGVDVELTDETAGFLRSLARRG